MTVQGFVTRQGSKLYLNGEPFRFAGPNIYWLGLDENVDGVGWPTEFRVLDALDTAVEMGATVVRAHTLGVSSGHPLSIQPELGVFNEEALRKVDFAVHAAGERGLRLIVPFVCNWHYYHGGRGTFAQWRGLDDPDTFYTDRDVVADFKRHVAALVGRVNTISGIPYRDDPAILAWELGNELNGAPVEWTAELAQFVKSLDGNHLVAHGKQFKLDADKLDVEALDILDVHYYPADAEELARDAAATAAAGKVYLCGEFGWTEEGLASFLERAEAEGAVSGTLYWSLFGHHDRCGYVQHNDGFTLHYPGTATGEETERRVALLREHAFRMSGREPTAPTIPAAPTITAADRGEIAFRGVVGGARYTLERSTAGPRGPWTVIHERKAAPLDGPWTDPERDPTAHVWYRVKAFNTAGAAGPCSEASESKPY